MKYDFNNRKEMLQITDYRTIYDFIDDICDTRLRLATEDVISIYGKSNFMQKLLYHLHNIDIGNDRILSLSMIEFDGEGIDYCGEYILTISSFNSDKIWIEPARNAIGGFKADESTLAYCYQEDIKHDLIEHLRVCNTPTLLFGFDG